MLGETDRLTDVLGEAEPDGLWLAEPDLDELGDTLALLLALLDALGLGESELLVLDDGLTL